jgi:hypothetical protein
MVLGGYYPGLQGELNELRQAAQGNASWEQIEDPLLAADMLCKERGLEARVTAEKHLIRLDTKAAAEASLLPFKPSGVVLVDVQDAHAPRQEVPDKIHKPRLSKQPGPHFGLRHKAGREELWYRSGVKRELVLWSVEIEIRYVAKVRCASSQGSQLLDVLACQRRADCTTIERRAMDMRMRSMCTHITHATSTHKGRTLPLAATIPRNCSPQPTGATVTAAGTETTSTTTRSWWLANSRLWGLSCWTQPSALPSACWPGWPQGPALCGTLLHSGAWLTHATTRRSAWSRRSAGWRRHKWLTPGGLGRARNRGALASDDGSKCQAG